jgi:adenylyltransferase/sulfurtransferase
VLNGIVGVMSGIASTETLKILLKSDKISREMVWLDLWENTSERIELPRMPDCPTCGQHHYEFLETLSGSKSTSLCGRNAVQVRPARQATEKQRIDFPGLAARLQALGSVQYNEFLLRCVIEGYELTVFPDARTIIKGTADEQIARTVYARYIGM